MPRLSTYVADYSTLETLPWFAWTDQERSYVISNAYEKLYLSSEQVKPYLNVAWYHFVSQLVVPVALAVGYKYGHKNVPFINTLYKRSLSQGNVASAAILGISTWLWINFSPLYIRKQESQQETLNLLYNKVGTGMKILNGFLPRTALSSFIDMKTYNLYYKRNSSLTGTLYAEQDMIPPILPKNKAGRNWKKVMH